MTTLLDIFKDKLALGQTVYGPFMKTGDGAFVECAAHSGFDFVILDMEHGPVDFYNLQNLIRAAESAGIVPIVRVCDTSHWAISKALDLGAKGVQIPQIASAEQAKTAIRLAKFFPEGERGVCRFVRAADYSSKVRDEYFNKANKALVILQIEGIEALNDLDEILNVEGIDILFIGPYDLSQSLGVPGQVSHPQVVAAIELIVAQARQKGVVTGLFCDTPQAAEMWRKAGVQYLSYSVDVGIFSEACKNIVENLKKSKL